MIIIRYSLGLALSYLTWRRAGASSDSVRESLPNTQKKSLKAKNVDSLAPCPLDEKPRRKRSTAEQRASSSGEGGGRSSLAPRRERKRRRATTTTTAAVVIGRQEVEGGLRGESAPPKNAQCVLPIVDTRRLFHGGKGGGEGMRYGFNSGRHQREHAACGQARDEARRAAHCSRKGGGQRCGGAKWGRRCGVAEGKIVEADGRARPPPQKLRLRDFAAEHEGSERRRVGGH